VTVVGAGGVEALVTDHFPTAREEVVAQASMLRDDGLQTEPPANCHELGREGRAAWVHSDRSKGQLALARLFRHEALDYEREPFRLVSLVGEKATPVLLAAIGKAARGDHHVALMREVWRQAKFRPYSVIDVRGLLDGPWRIGMKSFGKPFEHPILKPIVQQIPAGQDAHAA
jgi:hypothetical protein